MRCRPTSRPTTIPSPRRREGRELALGIGLALLNLSALLARQLEPGGDLLDPLTMAVLAVNAAGGALIAYYARAR